ncbi:MAG: phhA [Gammaproteobacteria bacterium]|jgi:phenylalanine-4-hydroxylase|nr:phhA [Gammaproteobacteria bacterium]
MQEELILDPKHPGIKDAVYIQRRQEFFRLGKEHRLIHGYAPQVEYSQEEDAIWQHINEKLEAMHQRHACDIYLNGKKNLGLASHKLPQLKTLSDRLQQSHGVRILPAEGLLSPREFFQYLSKRIMPCTQFLRHGSDPEYTPEPDIVHDVLGHLPPFMNADYAELMQLMGIGARHANEEEMLQWERLYWFAIEFGLILEQDELKIFGAGLLSSYGEMAHCLSDKVTRKPFDLEEVINTSYDHTQMQPLLFYVPSFVYLKNEIKKLIKN